LRPTHELAEVVERFGSEFYETYHPNRYVRRILRAIRCCRTIALGWHKDQCEECGHIRISYNSCRNRHCPKCQNIQRKIWIAERTADLLPVPYFHVVFTVPDKLNRFFLQDHTLMYNLLFQSVWSTLSQFFLTRMHGDGGMIAILHTWGQNLSLHPHIHCIVPAGCVDFKGRWKQIHASGSGKMYLFPVENLSSVFRGKFIGLLRRHFLVDKRLKKALFEHPWVVYAKEPFAGPSSVVEYLGSYSHKIAISNHRLVCIDDKHVTFRWRDYRDNKQKLMTLTGVEFLRRFCQHILPKGFVRIRHFGILSATRKGTYRELQINMGMSPSAPNKKSTRKSWKDICRIHLGYDPDLCPRCKKGKMVVFEKFFPGRGPPDRIPLSETFFR
jgi:hypothetical protein